MNEKHIAWHQSDTSRGDRERLFRQKGCVLWFTGLSGSGKSTIAHALEKELVQGGHAAYVLDGDNLRHRLNANLGFSEADRNENLRRTAEVSRLFAEAGQVCIAAFIAPFAEARAKARDLIGPERFLEIFLSTSLEECERRDVKGLYAKAREGEVPEFTGISSPYDPPEDPDLAIDTAEKSVPECVAALTDLLIRRGFVWEAPAS